MQVVEEGYEFFAKRQLVTIFSAPNYCGEFENAGAMMSVDETLMCSFQVSYQLFCSKRYWFFQLSPWVSGWISKGKTCSTASSPSPCKRQFGCIRFACATGNRVTILASSAKHIG